YVKERLGVYRYVGSGAGDYLPVRLVPLAGDKRLSDVNLSYQAGGHFSIGGEVSVSQFDKNIFSGQDDNDNTGQAFALGAGYRNAATELFGKSIGSVDWRLDWKRRQARFSPLDRLYQPGFDYKWNLNQAALQGDENTLESALLYRPFSLLQMDLNAGLINQGNGISSRRGRAELTSLDSTIFRGNAYLEQVNSEDVIQRSDWRRMGADFGKRFWKLYPYARFRQENRQVRNPDSSLTGFYFTEPSLGLQLLSVFGTNVNFTRTVRQDYLYNPREYGERLKLSTSSTNQLDMDVIQSQNWQGRLSFVYRDKNFTPFFEQLPADSMALFKPDAQFQDTTWQDRQSHLANLEIQYRNDSRTIDSRWDYQMASELSALQEKVFLNVGENRGNYRFDETLQEYVPDPQGDYLLVIVPTGRFESVTNVVAGWQIRYRPKISNKTYSGLSNVLHNISTFTYLKVDEKSREQNIWQLYILNLSKFHNTATTLEGSYTVNQDIYFFERNPDFGITLRNRYRDNLQNQYVDAGFNETRRLWDRSVAWRQKLYRRKLSQELEYTNSLNYRSVSAIPSRDRNVIGNSVNWTLNYRPVYAWQFRLDLEGAYQKDRAEANQLSVRYFEIKPQVDYSMRGKARGFANLSYLRVDVTDNPFGRPVPFEMGKGKKEGNSFLWNFRFEYFVSSNITASVNYTGRLDSGADRIIHLGQAEVRAFF
ncbi:MAG: hypothetical protein P8184_20655, partial [Calditrichia bacterium]